MLIKPSKLIAESPPRPRLLTEIISNFTKDNIIKGPRTRRRNTDRKVAYLIQLAIPKQLPGYILRFLLVVRDFPYIRFYRDELPPLPDH